MSGPSFGRLDVARGMGRGLRTNWNLASPFRWGVVQNIHSANQTADVFLDGSPAPTPNVFYLQSYVPSPGDVVVVGHMQGRARTAYWILGGLAKPNVGAVGQIIPGTQMNVSPANGIGLVVVNWTDPTNRVGDMIVRDQSGLNRLGIGAAGTVLQVLNLSNYFLHLENLGPLAYYRMNEASGLTMYDASNNGYGGTYGSSGVTYHVAPATGDADYAISFDGTNGYAEAPGGLIQNTDMSIVFFFKTTAAGVGTEYPMIANRSGGSVGAGSTNAFSIDILNGHVSWNENGWRGDTSTTWNDGNWHLCIVTRTFATDFITVDIDGASQTLSANSQFPGNSINSTAHVDFARYVQVGFPSSLHYPGALDEVAFFNFVLSGAQKTDLYNQWRGVASLLPTWKRLADIFAGNFGVPVTIGSANAQGGSGLLADALHVHALRPVTETDLSLSDILTANVSTSAHGLVPKLPNDATKYLDGTGAFSVPAGGGGGGSLASLTDVSIPSPADGDLLTYVASASKWENKKLLSSAAATTLLVASSTASTAVTDGAAFYDLPNLSLANVPAGTYLAIVRFQGSNKSGEVRVQIADGSNSAIGLSDSGGYDSTTRHNSDNDIQFDASDVITLSAAGTVKVRGAASAAVGNYNLGDRILALVPMSLATSLVATNYRASAHMSATFTQSSDNAEHQLPFNTADTDPNGNFSTANKNYVCPATGPYLVMVSAGLGGSGSGYWELHIRKNGTEVRQGQTAQPNAYISQQRVAWVDCNAGDTLDAAILNNSGVSLTWGNDSKSTEFEVIYLGMAANPMTSSGDMIGGGTNGGLTRIPAGTSGQYLRSQGTSGVPQWNDPPAYVKSIIGGVTPTSAASSYAEIDSSLRVTVTVPASGKVIIRQSLNAQVSAVVADLDIAVQVDGAGAWTSTGAFAFSTGQANQNAPIKGETELTGLTPGSHTFYMGWQQAGGVTMKCEAGSRGAAQLGTWQSVETVP